MTEKFNIGDRVVRIRKSPSSLQSSMLIGDEGIVKKCFKNGDVFIQYWFGRYDQEDFELAWQPKTGELIEIKYDHRWLKRVFVFQHKDNFYVENLTNENKVFSVKEIREYKKTYSVDLGGYHCDLPEDKFRKLKYFLFEELLRGK